METLPHDENCVAISARSGAGLDELLDLIRQNLERGLHHTVFLLPYAMAGQLDQLHQQAQVLRCDYQQDGIAVEAICDEILYGKLRAYEKEGGLWNP